MRVINLSVEGFGSFRDPCQLDFSDAPVVVAVGPNGAGKSTLFSALLWALYGNLPDRKLSEIHNPENSLASVSVSFELDDQMHYVSRTRNNSNNKTSAKLVNESGESTGNSEVTTLITNLLHADVTVLCQTAFARQGDFAQFTGGTATQRQTLLERALAMDEFKEARKQAQGDNRSSETQATLLLSNLELLQSEAQLLEQYTIELQAAEKQVSIASAEVDKLRNAARSQPDPGHLNQMKTAKTRLATELNQLRTLRLNRINSISTTQTATLAAQQAAEKAQEFYQAVMEKSNISTNARRVADLANGEAVGANERAEVLQRGGDAAECFICGSPLTPEHRTKVLEEINVLIQTAAQAEQFAQKTVKEVHQATEVYNGINLEAQTANTALEQAKSNIQKAYVQRRSIIQSAWNNRSISKGLEQAEASAANAPSEAQIRAASDAERVALQTEATTETALKRAQEASEKVPKVESEIEVVNQKREAAYWVIQATAPGQMMRIASDWIISNITETANRLLSDLGNMRVRITSEDGDGGIIKPVVELALSDMDWRPYSTFSGGERVRADIAMRIALTRRFGIRCRTLLVDEAEAALDSTGAIGLTRLINTLVSNGTLSGAFVVSHREETIAGYDKILSVRRENGTSKAVLI